MQVQALTNAYRKYCLGLKKADCLLAQQTSNPGFLRVVSDPPIPKRRPDLTTFLHKPLEVKTERNYCPHKKLTCKTLRNFFIPALPRNFEAFADRPEKL